MTQAKLIELIYKSMPYSEQITDLDLHNSNMLYFTWRGATFRVTMNLSVDEVYESIISRTRTTILIEQLLKNNNN